LLLSDFDYELPEELIAQHPPAERDGARLMVVDRGADSVGHARFVDLPELLRGDELLLFNDSKVIPARLMAVKASGGRVELLVVRLLGPTSFEAMTRSSKPLRVGQRLRLEPGPGELVVAELPAPGRARLEATGGREARELIHSAGTVPLPPYIRRPAGEEPGDRERYQTIFARPEGSVAAPTAGLHFTPRVVARLRERGCELAPVTLFVGPGTFQPVRCERVDEHRMEEELYEIPPATAAAVAQARREGRPILAVGTTTVRCVESAAGEDGSLPAGPGATSLFIHPGYRFKLVCGMVTNFHLPGSTLIMLVAALAGRELTLAAYREAVAQRYRFYSYGDCMLIR